MRRLKTVFNTYRQSFVTIGVVLVLALVVSIIVGAAHHKPEPGIDQLKKVQVEVSKHILLPTGETPTLATINDSSKLKSQAVFSNAQNGDKVLVYAKAQKVIVYRPSADRIVDVGPLVLDKNGSPYVTAKIAILNGSGNSDKLSTMTQAVLAAFPNATIVAKEAASRDFPTSIAIDLTKANQPLDEQVADTLGIKSGQLPLGISSPAPADIVIIIGQDYGK